MVVIVQNGADKLCRPLGIDNKTVLKYWNMTPDDYSAAKIAADNRTKKADRYKDFVLDCLQKYPDMSAAQVYDWIKERTGLETLEFQEPFYAKRKLHNTTSFSNMSLIINIVKVS